MKTKCTLMILAAFAVFAPMHAQNSGLTLKAADSSKFVLSVDNYNFGEPSTTFNVSNLTPGFHRVQMSKPADPRVRTFAAPEMMYDGFVFVPDSSQVTAVNTQRGQLNIVSIVPILQYLYGIITGNGGNNGNVGNNGNGTGTFPWGWPPMPQQGMSGADFQTLMATVSSKPFESTKLQIIKQALAVNKVTSAQVAQLMGLLDFESTKLDLAKFAYGKVLDKNNYYIVNNAFDFSSSSSELSQFIGGGF